MTTSNNGWGVVPPEYLDRLEGELVRLMDSDDPADQEALREVERSHRLALGLPLPQAVPVRPLPPAEPEVVAALGDRDDLIEAYRREAWRLWPSARKWFAADAVRAAEELRAMPRGGSEDPYQDYSVLLGEMVEDTARFVALEVERED